VQRLDDAQAAVIATMDTSSIIVGIVVWPILRLAGFTSDTGSVYGGLAAASSGGA